MGELRLTIGLPGSGKSEYAKTLLSLLSLGSQVWYRINWDEMRKERGMHLRNFSRKEEEQMQKDSFALAERLGREGANVIVDNTNLNPNTRNRWRGVAQRAGMVYNEVLMGVPLEECIRRDAKRMGVEQCGRAVIERMALFAGLIKFDVSERLVLVDMDGTLADCSHRRHFIQNHNHDWDQFEGPLILTDEPRYPILNLVNILQRDGFTVVIISGRQIDRTGKNTVTWLEKHMAIPYRHIFMRNGGDSRPDNIIKKEILDALVGSLPEGTGQISYVLDDRDQVVKMWRDEGLTCLQVAEGNF